MNIRERAEGTIIQEGAQVTSTQSADYFYFRHGQQIIYVRFPKDDARIEFNEWIAPTGAEWIRSCPAYSNEDIAFLTTALKDGKFALLKSDPTSSICRILVTVGNESRPFDMSRELMVEAEITLDPR